MDVIPIRKVSEPFGWLGNMSPHPIRHEGLAWRTAEALFQALRFDNQEVREHIRAQPSPMGAKLAAKARRLQMTVEPMSPADLDNMRLVLRLKLAQHPELRAALLATAPAAIVEDCTKRPNGSGLFWGAQLLGDTWVGHNWLGKLWMELRDELSEQEQA